MTTKNFTTLHVEDTIYEADSVEWCSIKPYQDIFVCGTYHLLEQDSGQKRIGSIILYQVTKGKVNQLDQVDCPAVLDMKWCPVKVGEHIILAIANAVGEICVFYLENAHLKFVVKHSLKKTEDDFLVLSLDWSKDSSNSYVRLCASDSKGNITLLDFADGCLEVKQEWNAHSLEAWIVCFDSFNSHTIFSGGDDGKLQIWDLRMKELISSTVTRHTSGVTALHSNCYKDHILASGSYDENVYIWDVRNWKQPVHEIRARGGLWRLKWEPRSRSSYLLSACIYGGYQIINVDTCAIVADYREHESLAYGADWCHLPGSQIEEMFGSSSVSLITTCSFYDHKLCVSLWDENNECC